MDDCDSRLRATDCERTDSAHIESAEGETGERVGVAVINEEEFNSSGRGPECVREGMLSGSLNDDKEPRMLCPPADPVSETGEASPLRLIGDDTKTLSRTGRKNAGLGGGVYDLSMMGIDPLLSSAGLTDVWIAVSEMLRLWS